MKKVCIVGLGFVGSAMSIAVSRPIKNNKPLFNVVGIDQDTTEGNKRIDKLNKAIFPFPTKDKFLKKTLKIAVNENNNFFATSNFDEITNADVIIVDINLDVDKSSKNGEIIIEPFKECIKSISLKCRKDALILVETTVPPGTTNNIVLPIFLDSFKKRKIETDPLLAHSYERVMPGPNYLDSIINFPRVYSAVSSNAKKKCREFLSLVLNGNLSFVKNTKSSEMAKVLENSYRAMNIAFIEEWSIFAEKAGVDLYEVLNVIRSRSTHNNIMSPGLGVGGYCLTKDSLLADWSSTNLFNNSELILSKSSVLINDEMANKSFERLYPFIYKSGKKILLLGASYLPGIGDERSSPAIALYKKLIDKKFNVEIIDEYLDFSLELNKPISKNPKFKKYDSVILTTAHSRYLMPSFIKLIFNLNPNLIIDCWGKWSASKFKKNYKFIQLGNGETF